MTKPYMNNTEMREFLDLPVRNSIKSPALIQTLCDYPLTNTQIYNYMSDLCVYAITHATKEKELVKSIKLLIRCLRNGRFSNNLRGMIESYRDSKEPGRVFSVMAISLCLNNADVKALHFAVHGSLRLIAHTVLLNQVMNEEIHTYENGKFQLYANADAELKSKKKSFELLEPYRMWVIHRLIEYTDYNSEHIWTTKDSVTISY